MKETQLHERSGRVFIIHILAAAERNASMSKVARCPATAKNPDILYIIYIRYIMTHYILYIFYIMYLYNIGTRRR